MTKTIIKYQDIPINHTLINQSLLDISIKVRSNLFSWNGQFSPQFVEALLTNFANTTDIDEILIVRKAKRISSNIRKEFSTYAGRQKNREWYVNYLTIHLYSVSMLKRFVDHIFSQMKNEDLIEESVLDVGYF